MKTSRFSEPQILAILRQAEGGVSVPLQVCRISSAVRSTTLPPLRICWPAPFRAGSGFPEEPAAVQSARAAGGQEGVIKPLIL